MFKFMMSIFRLAQISNAEVLEFLSFIHSFMNPLNALVEGIGQCSYRAHLSITVHNVDCKDPATVSFRVTLPHYTEMGHSSLG